MIPAATIRKLRQLQTPTPWWLLGIAGTLLILVQPIFSVLYYYWNLRMGAYPAHADSIAIPIFYAFVSWVILAPIALGGLWWAVWKHPEARPVFGWNRQRPIWSGVWTAVFVLLYAACVFSIPGALRWLNLPEMVNITLWIGLLLCLRAVVIFKRSVIA
ncbi:MAG TPA: hypothetical protein VNQ90_11310 [Chthoniobacteraceae bacterium]|nr:hypothetical protein [Chthoniobacteraceae bacterium]